MVLQSHQHGAAASGFKALRRAALMTLITIVVGGVSVTTAFQHKLSLSVVVGSTLNLSVATKLDFQGSTGVNMQHKFTTWQMPKPSPQEARKCVLQSQRHGAAASGFKALRRAALMTLITIVVGGVSVTTAFQHKLSHSIHYPY